MIRLIEYLSEADNRRNLGRAIERQAREVFDVVRWISMVGFARYLEVQTSMTGFMILRWVLTVFLFGYIVSRFLLRPEITIFPETTISWQRIVQFLVNVLICLVVFLAVIWSANSLAEAVARYRGLS